MAAKQAQSLLVVLFSYASIIFNIIYIMRSEAAV